MNERTIRRIFGIALTFVILAFPRPARSESAAGAGGGSQRSVTLTGLRSWSAPTSTRVVFDFSAIVTVVAPDSGISRRLTITIPGESIIRSQGVPEQLKVSDGVVDSVVVASGRDGGRFDFTFTDTTRFRVFSLPSEPDKPFRLVLDVVKRGGGAAQDARLASIAAGKRQGHERIVAVDPGHGGDDMGAHGPRGVLEKN